MNHHFGIVSASSTGYCVVHSIKRQSTIHDDNKIIKRVHVITVMIRVEILFEFLTRRYDHRNKSVWSTNVIPKFERC